jgi:hypothetical protein
MVKKLDLLESDHGCGLSGLSREEHSKTEVTQRYTVHNWRVTFSSQPFGAWGHHPWIQHVRVFFTLRPSISPGLDGSAVDNVAFSDIGHWLVESAAPEPGSLSLCVLIAAGAGIAKLRRVTKFGKR